MMMHMDLSLSNPSIIAFFNYDSIRYFSIF